MTHILQILPSLDPDEMNFIQALIKDMTEEQQQQFAYAYRARRKDPQTIMLTALVGFLGIAGIHRFILNQIGMGLLYLFTAGICWIGTIVDLVNYRTMTFEYNQKQAQDAAYMVRAMSQ